MPVVPHFSLELGRVIEQLGLRDNAVARKAGVSPSLVSRIRSGKARRITPETFTALAKAISNDPDVHSRLLCAYLKGVSRGLPGAEKVTISYNTDRQRQSVAARLTELPPSLEHAFSILVDECLADPTWSRAISSFAEWLESIRQPRRNA